jgi:hypothetical protein
MKSMKKSIIMTATALLLSVSIAAQTNDPVQNQTKVQNKEQNKEQTMTKAQQQEKVMYQQGNMTKTKAQNKAAVKESKEKKVKTKTKKANHGQTVSETARNTESGSGKGEIVSEQAKLQGETQQARIKNQVSAKNQSANTGARPANAMQQNRTGAAKGSGAGRK